MATSGIRSAAHAIRRQDTQAVEQRVRELEYAQVTEVNPLRAELHGHNIELDEHDVAFGQWLKRYDRKKGVKVGDTLVVKRMRNQTWIATDAISTESATGHQDFTAGDGLSFSGDDNDVLDVGAGTGLNVGATNVSIDEDWLEDFVDTHAGPSITAGDGLTLTGAVLDVGAGTGITVAANNVAVDTTVISTRTYAEGLVTTHETDTTGVHGIADTSLLATSASVTSAISTHESDTTSVHGITNTANIAFVNAANTFTLAQTLSNTGGKTTLALTSTGTDTGLTLGGDTTLYRSAASSLKTDDTFVATGGSATAYHSLHNFGYTAYDMDYWDLQKPTGGRLIFRSGAYPQVELRPANGGLGGNFQFYDAAGALAHQIASSGDAIYYDGVAAGSTMNLRPGGGSATKLQITGTAMTSTVPLAMGASKITGLAAATANGDAVRYEQAILNTLADAKGDLIAGTAADTVSRLAVGANGLFLKADSTQSTGLIWASVGGGGDMLASTYDPNTDGIIAIAQGGTGASVAATALSNLGGAGTGVANTFTLGQTVSHADGLVLSANGGKDTLSLSNTTADVGLTIGADTNLYRAAANTLKTDDDFHATLNIIANRSGTHQVKIMADNARAEISFGNGEDVNLYRSAANVLKTDDALAVVGNFACNNATPAAPPDYTTSNVTTDRTLNANATSMDELADVLGTLIADLTAAGLLA